MTNLTSAFNLSENQVLIILIACTALLTVCVIVAFCLIGHFVFWKYRNVRRIMKQYDTKNVCSKNRMLISSPEIKKHISSHRLNKYNIIIISKFDWENNAITIDRRVIPFDELCRYLKSKKTTFLFDGKVLHISRDGSYLYIANSIISKRIVVSSDESVSTISSTYNNLDKFN